MSGARAMRQARTSHIGAWSSQATSAGEVHVAVLDGAVVYVGLGKLADFKAELAERYPSAAFACAPDDPLLVRTHHELGEYFGGKRQAFDVPVHLEGTPFQRAVWKTLARIPYGVAWSYADVAQALGKPGAARAVGQANRRNPVPILIPCHRVIAADGGLGGYMGEAGRGGGPALKARLLELENGRTG